MKKRIASIFTVLTMLLMLVPAGVFAEGEDIAIDANNFPDDNFRRFVQQYDTDSDGFLSQAERESVIEMNVDNREISDLTGIEHFSRLQTLNCSVNQLTELDVSKCERLFSLDCSGNQLTTLDVSKNTMLGSLGCFGNRLTELDVSKNTMLFSLNCFGNRLTELDVSQNTMLGSLDCSGNRLTELDVSKCEQLDFLGCSGNQLTTLDVSNCERLLELNCNNNQLTGLDVSKCEDLKKLYCQYNALLELYVNSTTGGTIFNVDLQNVTREVPVTTGEGGETSWTLDLSELFKNWENVTNLEVKNAELGKDGKTVSWTDSSAQPVVKYAYQCANSETMRVTLNLRGIIPVTGVKLEKEELSLVVGGSEQLQYTIEPENATDQTVKWESSDAAATVDENGLVTAVSVGQAVITVTTPDGCTDSCTVTVTGGEPLTDALVKVIGDYTYDGSEKKPSGSNVTVTLNGKTLSENTDYTLSYADNINAGTASVTVTGMGRYEGTATGCFTIRPAQLTVTGATLEDKTYDGSTSATVTEVTFNDESLTSGTDYTATAEFEDANAGEGKNATVTVALKEDGNYTFADSSMETTYQLTGQTIAKAGGVSTTTGTMTVTNNLAKTYTYDLSQLLPTLDSGKTFGTVSYALGSVSLGSYNTEGASIDGSTLTLPIQAVVSSEVKEIGTVTVTISSTNYADMTATIRVSSVNKLSQSIEIASPGAKTYGDAPFALSITGGSGTGAVTWSLTDGAGVISLDGNNVTILKAGTATVTAVKAEDDTYAAAQAQLTITVGKAALEVKADDKSVMVGSPMPELTYTVTGLVEGDSFTAPEITTAAADTNTVGEFDITISGGSLSNAECYDVTYEKGKLTVTEKNIVSLTLSANQTNLTGGGTVTLALSGLPEGTEAALTCSDSSAAISGSGSSWTVTLPNKTAEYTFTASFAGNDSYAPATANCTVSVTEKAEQGGEDEDDQPEIPDWYPDIPSYNPGGSSSGSTSGSNTGSGTVKPSEPETEWVRDENGNTYFTENGEKVTGWVEQDGKWYYMDEKTAIMSEDSWVKIDNVWYAFDDFGVMLTGWQEIDGKWYYLKDWGGMATGWQYIDGVWYYLRSDGAMSANAWVQTNGQWYYMTGSGAMAANKWVEWKGEWYYLYSNGQMATNATIGGYYVNSDGVWVP